MVIAGLEILKSGPNVKKLYKSMLNIEKVCLLLRRFPKSIEIIRTSNFYFNMAQIHFFLRRFPKSIEIIRTSNFYFNGTNPFL